MLLTSFSGMEEGEREMMWGEGDSLLAREMRREKGEEKRETPLCPKLGSVKEWSSLFETWRGSFRAGGLLAREEEGERTILRLGKKLGEGGFGAVYAAKIVSSSSSPLPPPSLAVKRFKRTEGYSESANEERMLIREVVVNSILFCRTESDFIAEPLFAIRTEGGDFGVGMRRMDSSLNEYLSSLPHNRKRREFLRTTIQLAEGILHLQEKFRFVHGDLKLNNVMVSNKEGGEATVHLIDFGFSMLDLTSRHKKGRERRGRFSVDPRYNRPVFNRSHDFLNYIFTLPAFGDAVSPSSLDVASSVLSDFHIRLETDEDERWVSLHRTILKLIESGFSSSNALYWSTIYWLDYEPTRPESILSLFSSELEKE